MKNQKAIESIIQILTKYKFILNSEIHIEGTTGPHESYFYYKCSAQSQCHLIGIVHFSFRMVRPEQEELQKELIEMEVLDYLEGKRKFILMSLESFPIEISFSNQNT